MLTTTAHCPTHGKPTPHGPIFVDKAIGAVVRCLPCVTGGTK